MLDGLLGRGFSSKCKSSIKQLKCRIELIRRKRGSMFRFLRKDIADLLKSGLDLNAYQRVEGLIKELNLSTCYELVLEFCNCIQEQLPILQKERDCPEQCKEAISSLMFAAARFADLPELRDLRSVFSGRYGDRVSSFVNEELKEKLASKSPSMDQKLILMQAISKEFSITWDSKAFKEKISNPSTCKPDQSEKHDSLLFIKDDSCTELHKQVSFTRGDQEVNLGTKNTRQEEVKHLNDPNLTKSVGNDRRFRSNILNQEELSKFGKESSEKVKPQYNNISPPYIKPTKTTQGDSNCKESPDKLTNDRKISETSPTEQNSKPTPRSVRRRPSKKFNVDSIATPVDNGEDSDDRKTNEQSIPTSSADQYSNEGTVMNKLFSYFRNKQSDHQISNLTTGENTSHHAADDGGYLPSQNDDRIHASRPSPLAHMRVTSLPPEPPAEVTKLHLRSATFQPDTSLGHVHPKLPDYDDLQARFAALRGKC